MTIIEAFILGVVQGITEFLPISSSGHLVILQSILEIKQPGNDFEIIVHLGTLGSIIVVFFKDLKTIVLTLRTEDTKKLLYYILIGTLPSVLFVIGFKDTLETLFESVKTVGFALLFTGTILYLSSLIKKRNNSNSYYYSLIIGFAQALAIIPGISRSGMTICCSVLIGMSPPDAAKFSFLLAIPALSGAGLLTILDLNHGYGLNLDIKVLVIGLLSSFIVGIISLKWLLQILNKGRFHYFGMYCILIGIIALLS